MKGLSSYLNKYYKYQEQIVLVCRKSERDNWSDRCLFLDDKYSAHKPYNHRSILTNEVVIEYDEDDPKVNQQVTSWAISKLNADNIIYSRWKSGGKSTHIHIMVDLQKAQNIPLLKNAFMRHYGTYYIDEQGKLYQDKPTDKVVKKILPDLRLCSVNHLIRAENGIHEKSGNKKSLVCIRGNYPELNPIPMAVWERYTRQQQLSITRRMMSPAEHTEDTKQKMNKLLNTTTFKDNHDGRERALFIIIHYLKPSYTDRKGEMIKYVTDWYKYSGGYKLTEQQIASKVHYHWPRDYRIERVLNELLEQLNI